MRPWLRWLLLGLFVAALAVIQFIPDRGAGEAVPHDPAAVTRAP